MDEQPVTVLYIVGAGRSGSTVLDVVLGSHPAVESVGELTNLARSGLLGERRAGLSSYCSCGELLCECPFWSEVRAGWTARAGEKAVRSYPALQDSFERYRRLPRLLLERRYPTERFREYQYTTAALFRVIRETSGARVVVDSSKNPLRAIALSTVPGIDLRVVHLVRDVRGVVCSQGKSFRRDEGAGLPRDLHAWPAWRSASLWVYVNLLSGWLRRQLGSERAVRVHYEDFVERPGEVLAGIGRVAGLDFSGVARRVSAGGAVPVGHNTGGNRLRVAGEVRLSPDAGGWRGALSSRRERVAWAVAGWLAGGYGYRR